MDCVHFVKFPSLFLLLHFQTHYYASTLQNSEQILFQHFPLTFVCIKSLWHFGEDFEDKIVVSQLSVGVLFLVLQFVGCLPWDVKKAGLMLIPT